jgi:hypothetical protein
MSTIPIGFLNGEFSEAEITLPGGVDYWSEVGSYLGGTL